ncbi:MAG: beta-barrel assembly-enhancing protease [Gammaproteobacteria bacterium]|jgi:predicted Zn-dependent protease|nr:beta-barrel assembly-enhancing protease [Gammaproteobacteria bacterium]
MKFWKALVAWTVAFAMTASTSLGWAAGFSAAEQDLPELGSPANAAVSLEDEYQAGLGWFREMSKTGVVMEDPEVGDYIQEIGHSLSSRAEEGQHQFYYFVVRDPVINAFAMPGGFIAINSGLILATRNENQLAGVMAHETAHVTQRHLVRGLIDQSHAGLVATAAMLAAILLGATAGHGSPDAMEGAIMATQGAAIQHQINYTRANEFEADRIGIGTMATAGYDPLGMASFFQELEKNSPEPSRTKAVEFLIDHPLSAERVAEARNRAEQIGRVRHEDSLGYKLMRERLRSLVGDPRPVRDYYVNLVKNGAGLTMEERYGKDIADIAMRNPTAAIPDLQTLVREYPKVTQFYGALGQAYMLNGQLKESQALLDKGLGLFPRNVPITIRLSETLMRSGDNKRAQLLLDDLFNFVEPSPDQTKLIAKAASAAGDLADSYYYMSFYWVMSGDLKMAATQLQLALALPGLDPIQRARFSARLDEIKAAMPKNRKTTVADDGGDGNGRH